MRLCANENLPGECVLRLRQSGHDVLWIREARPGSPDTEVLTIAHAEGRFYADEKTLDALEQNDQVLFRYCTPSGEVTAEANPNGAARNIAGICNDRRNVFGMMPHPERASESILGNADGHGLFESLLQAVAV